MEVTRKWTELGMPSPKLDRVVGKEAPFSIMFSKLDQVVEKKPEMDRVGSPTNIIQKHNTNP